MRIYIHIPNRRPRLTRSQEVIFQFIKGRREVTGSCPSIAELADQFDLSDNYVRDILRLFVRYGYMRTIPRRSAGMCRFQAGERWVLVP